MGKLKKLNELKELSLPTVVLQTSKTNVGNTMLDMCCGDEVEGGSLLFLCNIVWVDINRIF